jgi:hypothetical protein
MLGDQVLGAEFYTGVYFISTVHKFLHMKVQSFHRKVSAF